MTEHGNEKSRLSMGFIEWRGNGPFQEREGIMHGRGVLT